MNIAVIGKVALATVGTIMTIGAQEVCSNNLRKKKKKLLDNYENNTFEVIDFKALGVKTKDQTALEQMKEGLTRAGKATANIAAIGVVRTAEHAVQKTQKEILDINYGILSRKLDNGIENIQYKLDEKFNNDEF